MGVCRERLRLIAQFEIGKYIREEYKKFIPPKREMDQAEITALERAQASYLDRVGADTPFTAALICQMHRDWLDELYAWAGSYRTVELAKAGFAWPPARMVEQNMPTYERTVLGPKTPSGGGISRTTARWPNSLRMQSNAARHHPDDSEP